MVGLTPRSDVGLAGDRVPDAGDQAGEKCRRRRRLLVEQVEDLSPTGFRILHRGLAVVVLPMKVGTVCKEQLRAT